MSRVAFAVLLAFLLVWGSFGSLGLFSWASQHLLGNSTESTESVPSPNVTVIYKSKF